MNSKYNKFSVKSLYVALELRESIFFSKCDLEFLGTF